MSNIKLVFSDEKKMWKAQPGLQQKMGLYVEPCMHAWTVMVMVIRERRQRGRRNATKVVL